MRALNLLPPPARSLDILVAMRTAVFISPVQLEHRPAKAGTAHHSLHIFLRLAPSPCSKAFQRPLTPYPTLAPTHRPDPAPLRALLARRRRRRRAPLGHLCGGAHALRLSVHAQGREALPPPAPAAARRGDGRRRRPRRARLAANSSPLGDVLSHSQQPGAHDARLTRRPQPGHLSTPTPGSSASSTSSWRC